MLLCKLRLRRIEWVTGGGILVSRRTSRTDPEPRCGTNLEPLFGSLTTQSMVFSHQSRGELGPRIMSQPNQQVSLATSGCRPFRFCDDVKGQQSFRPEESRGWFL